MRPTYFSSLFTRTMREDPTDENVESAKLLVRGGYVRKMAPGVFAWLPLGLKVLENVEKAIREEMAHIGAQEVHLPALLPKSVYAPTGRWDEYGDNIFKLKDRHGADYLLAPTHEEPFTLLAKDLLSSYKDLPVTLYQIQTKYRDEARPRAGLIRGREFIMKDAYSFTLDEEGMKACYSEEREAYEKVFRKLGISYVIVHAFSGPMGGSESEEFLCPLEIGEDTFVQAPSGKAWNVEALKTVEKEEDFSSLPLPKEISTPGGGSIASLEAFLEKEGISSQILKNIAVVLKAPDGKKSVAVVGLPSDRQLDLKRLEACLSPMEVSIATEEDLKDHPELVKGFIGVGKVGPQASGPAKCPYFLDAHVFKGSSWCTGSDKKGFHTLNMVCGRDFGCDKVVEAAQVKEGDLSPDGSGKLAIRRGVEIGQVFQLGLKYSRSMGFKVAGPDGSQKDVWMGSYGIGVSRIIACIAESYRDEKGLIWPITVAPFKVHIVCARKECKEECERLGVETSHFGLETLIDDRNESAGVKFADADLLGCPIIAIAGKGYMENGEIEIKIRKSGEVRKVQAREAAKEILALSEELRSNLLDSAHLE
ncbi:MAG: proline--tRNA ligase [Aeriscardovia sp.]|nr:proline--tRNA ligase [Aeriscardovia sp.]